MEYKIKLDEEFNIVSKKNILSDYKYFENCELFGYMPEGDSFLFSKGQGPNTVILCLTRQFLEKTLLDYPKNKSIII